jgi:3-oxoacyl-[acyl-carrier-protein] synthase II
MSTTRVLVTGLGTTSPLGGDTTSTWSAMLAGQSGVDVMKHEWAQELSTQIAAEVAVQPTDVLDRVKARRLDRSGQLALVAALEAWSDAGFGEGGEEVDPERLGVALASGIGGVQTLLNNYDSLKEKGPRRVSPLAIPMLMPNGPAASVGLVIGA